MFTYRNNRTGEIFESPMQRLRFERSPFWDRVEAALPAEPLEQRFDGRPSVWFVSPAHGRFGVTRLALAQRVHAISELREQGIDAHGVIVACDENLEIAAEFGFDTLDVPNAHLGKRFNAGIAYACRLGADFIAHIGSDDWMHPDCFAHLPAPDTILSGRKIAVVDLEAGKLRRLNVNGRHGVIPWIVPRALLEPSGYRPIKPEKRRGIDGSLVRGVTRGGQPRWLFHDPHDFARIDWKSSANITPYELVSRNLGMGPEIAAPWRQLEEFYPPELVRQAVELHHELAGDLAGQTRR